MSGNSKAITLFYELPCNESSAHLCTCSRAYVGNNVGLLNFYERELETGWLNGQRTRFQSEISLV